MVEKIKTGTLLIEEGVIFPDSLQVESEPYSNGWSIVKELDGYGLDRTMSQALSMPLIYGQDLSRYREFQFGMNLPTVAKQADVKQSEAKAVHQRPAMIQELQWRPQHYLSASPQSDPIKDVLFSFYNGELSEWW